MKTKKNKEMLASNQKKRKKNKHFNQHNHTYKLIHNIRVEQTIKYYIMHYTWFEAHPTQAAHPPHLRISKFEKDLSFV
jgi:hypothetical protein